MTHHIDWVGKVTCVVMSRAQSASARDSWQVTIQHEFGGTVAWFGTRDDALAFAREKAKKHGVTLADFTA